MAVLRIQNFSGAVPVRGDRALPDSFATEAFNTWLYGEELRGIRPPLDIIAIQAATRDVMRIPKRTVGGDPAFPGVVPPPSYLGDSVWVQFTDPDTDVVKGQLVEDQFERWYFCSPTRGPEFNTYARLLAGQSALKLGVPGPNIDIDAAGNNADKPTIVSITGGAAPVLTRSYLYTWVNEYGEESAPSLPVLGSGNANAVWTIGNIKDPPALAGYAAYTKKYLYRTITGTSGQTTYYRVNEVPIGTLTYADNASVMTDAVLANQLTLESTSWQPPPATLQGWVAMPNGFLIGFDKPVPGAGGGNNIYFSESYHFHAWPPEYKQATETPVVGLGVLGQTCVVCTQGYPATITGTKPAACAFTKATTGEPCLSRGGIVSTPDGVVYPSQNGLMMVGPAGIQNVTEAIITREEWIKNYAPQYIRACRYQNGYLALRDLPSPNPNSGFFLDPTALKVALTELSEFDVVDNLIADFWSGEVFLLEAGQIRRWDPPTTDLLPVMWRSKEFQYAFKENFGVYAVYWDPARYANNTIGADVCPVGEQVRLRVLANRQTVYDQAVPVNGQGIRLPSGFKADIWQFELRARAPVYSLHVASTMKELKAV